MKYTYIYKTSDGVRHEAAMDAESREAVFAALREKGIKAIKVVAADGSKANGEIRGIRKRVLAAAVVGACVVTAILTVIIRSTPTPSTYTSFDNTTRRQIIGDTAIIEKGIRTGWADVFELEGERFLASFAIPGVPAGQRNTTEEEIRKALSTRHSALGTQSDSLEARQIVAMVEGMKAELRAYLAAGGTIIGYGKRLTERQDAEIALYERVRAEVDAAAKTIGGEALFDFWEKRNDRLRRLGIRLVPLPE